MNMITKSPYIISLLFVASVTGQNNVQSRVDGTQRDQPAPVNNLLNAQSTPESDVSQSDTGAQRPVSVNESGISGFFGYNTKVVYRDNPTAQETKLSELKGAVWTNTFFAGGGLGVFDMGNSIVTPYIGGSYAINDYLEDEVQELGLNYNSTSAYALLLAQYANGWSARVGVTYTMDKNTETDFEDYSEYFPNFGVMKAFAVSQTTTGVFDAYIGSHSSTIATGLGIPEDNLDNIEYAASYGLITSYGNLKLFPKYLISYKDFENGQNVNRDDLTHNLSVKVDYPLTDSFDISLMSIYTVRDSSGALVPSDYKNFDGGVGITLNSRF